MLDFYSFRDFDSNAHILFQSRFRPLIDIFVYKNDLYKPIGELVKTNKRLVMLVDTNGCMPNFSFGSIPQNWHDKDEVEPLIAAIDADMEIAPNFLQNEIIWEDQAQLTPNLDTQLIPLDVLTLNNMSAPAVYERLINNKNWRNKVNILKIDYAGYSPIIYALIDIQENRGDAPE